MFWSLFGLQFIEMANTRIPPCFVEKDNAVARSNTEQNTIIVATGYFDRFFA
jgi:hypothetical protein